jgi:hypothetical protein
LTHAVEEARGDNRSRLKLPPALARPAAGRPVPFLPRQPAKQYGNWLRALGLLAGLAIAGGALLIHVETDRTNGSTSTTGSSAADPLTTEPFTCGGSTGLGVSDAPAVAFVSAIGAAQRSGFDRVTFAFRNGRPRDVVIATQNSAQFTAAAGGQATVLKGAQGATITMYNSDTHTEYHGPTDIQTGYSTVVELRQIAVSTGSVVWAIGLAGAPCYRVAFYDKPAELVADFRSS